MQQYRPESNHWRNKRSSDLGIVHFQVDSRASCNLPLCKHLPFSAMTPMTCWLDSFRQQSFICDSHAHTGPSGAGKTTLLHALASRSIAARLEGTVLVNGVPRSRKSFRQSESVLAEQEQSFLASLSVQETLRVHCMLQRPGFARFSSAKKNAIEESLLQLMGLYSVRHTRVSNHGCKKHLASHGQTV